MSKRKGRLRFILIREAGKLIDYIDQFLSDQFQCLCHHDNICIISNITGSRSEMDDSLRLRTLLTISVDMGHNVMTHKLFPFSCNIVIDVIRMCLKLFDLLVRNRKSQFFFRFRQSDPKFSPRSEFHIRRKNILHFFTCIPF